MSIVVGAKKIRWLWHICLNPPRVVCSLPYTLQPNSQLRTSKVHHVHFLSFLGLWTSCNTTAWTWSRSISSHLLRLPTHYLPPRSFSSDGFSEELQQRPRRHHERRSNSYTLIHILVNLSKTTEPQLNIPQRLYTRNTVMRSSFMYVRSQPSQLLNILWNDFRNIYELYSASID